MRGMGSSGVAGEASGGASPSRPSPRTNRTRLVPLPVLTGHVLSLSPSSRLGCRGERGRGSGGGRGWWRAGQPARKRRVGLRARRERLQRPRVRWQAPRGALGDRPQPRGAPRLRDETCPISTGGGTRRFRLVRGTEGGGGGASAGTSILPSAISSSGGSGGAPRRPPPPRPAPRASVSSSAWAAHTCTRRVQLVVRDGQDVSTLYGREGGGGGAHTCCRSSAASARGSSEGSASDLSPNAARWCASRARSACSASICSPRSANEATPAAGAPRERSARSSTSARMSAACAAKAATCSRACGVSD